MPVRVSVDICPLTQEKFGEIAYQVTGHAFAIYEKMGGFFDEDVYRDQFVNTRLKRADRTRFRVVDEGWIEPDPERRPVLPWLNRFLRDIGAGLDQQLYQEAVCHFYGGDEAVMHSVEIVVDERAVGYQHVRLAAPGCAFKVTTLAETEVPHFEGQARRFLEHTQLEQVHWINVTREVVRFQTFRRGEDRKIGRQKNC